MQQRKNLLGTPALNRNTKSQNRRNTQNFQRQKTFQSPIKVKNIVSQKINMVTQGPKANSFYTTDTNGY